MSGPRKSLGQHWLHERDVLAGIAEDADIRPGDVILEIGPGLGTLTSVLLSRAKQVIAVEFDSDLARKLPGQFPGKNLTVKNEDFLKFDLTQLPDGYKVVANVPYYITSRIVQLLLESRNPPDVAVLLVQKEVAERLAAQPGGMSVLSVAAQVYADVFLGDVVPAELFTPPPKVDSQVVVLKRKASPLLAGGEEQQQFFRVVKAGFSARRKKLRSSMAGGLGLSKPEAERILVQAGIDPDRRAESLGIDEWIMLSRIFSSADI